MFRFSRLLAAFCLLFQIGAAHAISVGDTAPNFSAPSLRDFEVLKLSKLRGKVVYLEFWASWCPPCWDAFPLLEQMQQELQEDGLVVIGVNIDDEMDDARQVMNKLGASFPLVRPDQNDVKLAYGIKSMPYGVLIDRKGVVRYTSEGMSRSKLRDLKKEIRRLQWTGL